MKRKRKTASTHIKLGRGRCDICGQYISLKFKRAKEIDWFYIPHTPFTVERVFFAHKSCIRKNRHDIKYQIFHQDSCLWAGI